MLDLRAGIIFTHLRNFFAFVLFVCHGCAPKKLILPENTRSFLCDFTSSVEVSYFLDASCGKSCYILVGPKSSLVT